MIKENVNLNGGNGGLAKLIGKRKESEFEKFRRENELQYTYIKRQMKEIQDSLNCVNTEQERQRLEQMTITEVQTEMLRVLHEMKISIDRISED